MEIKNIYQKLFEIRKADIKLQRDTKAFNYKYATLSQIQEKLSDIIEKEWLLITHRIENNKVITDIINIDKPEEKITSEIEMAEWIKPQDKGSEITYYRRYNLLALLDLEVEDDDWKKAQDSKWNFTKNDDLPWYNDFEKHKDLIIEQIKGWKTANEIIKNLTKKYKVNSRIRQSIKDLETDYKGS